MTQQIKSAGTQTSSGSEAKPGNAGDNIPTEHGGPVDVRMAVDAVGRKMALFAWIEDARRLIDHIWWAAEHSPEFKEAMVERHIDYHCLEWGEDESDAMQLLLTDVHSRLAADLRVAHAEGADDE